MWPFCPSWPPREFRPEASGGQKGHEGQLFSKTAYYRARVGASSTSATPPLFCRKASWHLLEGQGKSVGRACKKALANKAGLFQNKAALLENNPLVVGISRRGDWHLGLTDGSGDGSDPLFCISLMLIIPSISICKYVGKDTNLFSNIQIFNVKNDQNQPMIDSGGWNIRRLKAIMIKRNKCYFS